MTAHDHETSNRIVNPYIEVSHNSDERVCINTGTFGEACQEELIHPLDSESLIEEDYYEVMAVVGEYNTPATKTVSLTGIARSRTFLGYLEKGVVEKNLPRTFVFFNKD